MDVRLLVSELGSVQTEHGLRGPDEPRQDLLERARALEVEARASGIPQVEVLALIRQAELLLFDGEARATLSALDRASKKLGRRAEQELGVTIRTLRARALAVLEDWPRVSQTCEEGIATVERYRSRVTPLGMQSAYLRFRVDLYSLGARAAVELGDLKLALRRTELAKCRSLGLLRQAKPASSEEFAALERQFRDMCDRLDYGGLDGEEQTALLAKRRSLVDLMSILRSRARGDLADSFSLSAVRKRLAPDELVVYYYWLDRRDLLVVAIDDRRAVAQRVELSADDRACIDRIGDAVLSFRDGIGAALKPPSELSQVLFPGPISDLMVGKSRLLISPHRVLHSLPFHALRWCGEYLILKFAVTHIPNLTSITVDFQPQPTRSFLGLGVARYLGHQEAGNALPTIAEAEQEVTETRDAYRAAGLVGEALIAGQAREARLKALSESGRLRDYSHLHFACHGLNVDSDSPLESRLYLHDTALDGLEIANLELRADVVVLSACCSGQRPITPPALGGRPSEEELPGDEISGLPAAFFAGGARQVVSALWAVESSVAYKICTACNRRLMRGSSADRALQEAVIEYLDRAGPKARHPARWSPFVLMASGRPGGTRTSDRERSAP